MEDILKKMAVTLMIAAGGLMFLFLLIDLEIFGTGVKISNMYYLFMAIVFLAGIGLFRIRKNFR